MRVVSDLWPIFLGIILAAMLLRWKWSSDDRAEQARLDMAVPKPRSYVS